MIRNALLAMWSDWDAGSAKKRHSAAVKQEHGNGRISPRGDLIALFETIVYVQGR